MTTRLAIVGLGKIARDAHIPAIAAVPGFELAAIVSPRSRLDGTPGFPTLDALFADGPAVDAVVLCTPAAVRLPTALTALGAGKPVFLEKPPGGTLGEVDALRQAAAAAGVPLFASWHSRMAASVAAARDWAAGRTVTAADIRWREDARKWHPGQDWVLEAGGFGVFDPGINALSILTAVLPQPLFPARATLDVPANRGAPIAAEGAFLGTDGLTGSFVFDWRHGPVEEWSIDFTAAGGSRFGLRDGGKHIAGQDTPDDIANGEYVRLYQRWAEVLASGHSDVDTRPLQLVADIFMLAMHRETDAFDW